MQSFYRFLTTSNLTTNEDIKGAYSNKRTHTNFNPFSAGNAILNCNEVLCGPLNPSLIDARGYVTDDYLISVKENSVQPQANLQNNTVIQPSVAVLQQPQQEPEQPQESPRKNIEMRIPISQTQPEIASKKLPPITKSNTAQNLTVTNVGLHNKETEEVKVDLDQTTMIGSALDLDSLDSADESSQTVHNNGAPPSHAGSQVGLLKLSAV